MYKWTGSGSDYFQTTITNSLSEPGSIEFQTGIGGAAIGSDTQATKMSIFPSGRVGIGTTTPSEKLHVVGNILASGTITPSDRRLKKNIMPVRDAARKIASLQGVTYDWKEPKKHSHARQMGVIAQDVQKVFPEAVTKTNDGFLAVSYSVLVAPLIETVKELLSASEGQSRDIASIKVQNQKLEAKDLTKDQEIAKLNKESIKLAQENADMKSRLERLEKLIESQGRLPAGAKAKK
jgi:hypothetical protein